MKQYTHYSTEGGEEILYREVEKAAFPRRTGDHDTFAFGNGKELKIVYGSVKPASSRQGSAEDDHRDDAGSADEVQVQGTNGGEEHNSTKQPASTHAVCDDGVVSKTISSLYTAAGGAVDNDRNEDARGTDSAPKSSNEDEDKIHHTQILGAAEAEDGEEVYGYAFDPSDDSASWPREEEDEVQHTQVSADETRDGEDLYCYAFTSWLQFPTDCKY